MSWSIASRYRDDPPTRGEGMVGCRSTPTSLRAGFSTATPIAPPGSRRSTRPSVIRGKAALPALSGQFPGSAVANASARYLRRSAPRGRLGYAVSQRNGPLDSEAGLELQSRCLSRCVSRAFPPDRRPKHSMGGLLATIAVCVRQEVLLVLIGGVFSLVAITLAIVALVSLKLR